MFERFKARQAQKAFLKDPIVSFALEEFNRRLNDETNDLRNAPNDAKVRWVNHITQILSEIIQAETPFMKMREHLCNEVNQTSYFEVLMKHKLDANGHPISSISHPKISWRLSDHIYEIALKEENIGAIVRSCGENMNDVLDNILVSYQVHHLYMSTINAARIVMKDYSEQNWFLQFYICMCIYHEDRIRNAIGIPSLFNENDQPIGLDGLKYWSFLDFVKNGNKTPYQDWQALYASDFWK